MYKALRWDEDMGNGHALIHIGVIEATRKFLSLPERSD